MHYSTASQVSSLQVFKNWSNTNRTKVTFTGHDALFPDVYLLFVGSAMRIAGALLIGDASLVGNALLSILGTTILS